MPTVPSGQFEYPERNWAEGTMRKYGAPMPEEMLEPEVRVAGMFDSIKNIFGLGQTKAKPTPEGRDPGMATVEHPDPGRTRVHLADPMKEYPSDADVEFAKSSGFGYGTISEPYINQQTASVYGSVKTLPTGKGKTASEFVAASPAGKTLTDLMNEISKGKSVNIDLTKPENKEIRDRIGNTYAKAALAVEANPIAKLGFDPKVITADIGPLATVHGGYIRQRGSTPESLYANVKAPGVMVHESIHRGLRKLEKENSEAREIFASLGDEHELITRYLMVKYAGDAEHPPQPGFSQSQDRQDAIKMFENQRMSPEYRRGVERLMEIAAEAIAKKRPGGPR